MSKSTDLSGKRVLMLVGDIYEDLELWYPKIRLEEEGIQITLAGPEAGVVYKGKHGYPCKSDAEIDKMMSQDFDGIILPGGFMPDKLRRMPKVKALIREFDESGKLVAAICHGGWLAISAGVYKGVRVTGSLGIKDDLENAGAVWVDAPVVVDRHFVSSRNPDDLAHFGTGLLQVLRGA